MPTSPTSHPSLACHRIRVPFATNANPLPVQTADVSLVTPLGSFTTEGCIQECVLLIRDTRADMFYDRTKCLEFLGNNSGNMCTSDAPVVSNGIIGITNGQAIAFAWVTLVCFEIVSWHTLAKMKPSGGMLSRLLLPLGWPCVYTDAEMERQLQWIRCEGTTRLWQPHGRNARRRFK